VEMGMSARGEIAQLTSLAQPQIGLITTIAAAHLEGLGSLEEIARAKGELFVGLGEEGWAVLSEALPLREVALEGVRARLLEVERRLALEGAQVSVEGSSATLLYTQEGTQEGARYPLTLQLVGEHQLANAQLALGAALLAAQLPHPSSAQAHLTQDTLNFNRALITPLLFGLASAPPPPMRGEVSRLPHIHPLAEPAHLWLDCYNANPQSTLTSLSSFWRSGLRGVIVLGSLKELGEGSLQLHEALGREVARLSASLPSPTHEGELILTVGEEARAIAAGLRAEGYPHALISLSFEQLDEARELALSELCSASPLKSAPSLFVKGSRSGRLEVLAKALVEALERAAHLSPPTPSTSLKER
jgi:UDP-N-acetylmuramoyl-tripeptide--D-alanyl-D-alanine ligase